VVNVQFLKKPFTFNALATTIKAIMGGPPVIGR
jgi:hypothetical protein